jgi:hypothetical protein
MWDVGYPTSMRSDRYDRGGVLTLAVCIVTESALGALIGVFAPCANLFCRATASVLRFLSVFVSCRRHSEVL